MLRTLAVGALCLSLAGAADPPAAPAPAPAPAPANATSGQLRGTVAYARKDPAVGAIVIVRPEDAPSPLRVATTGTNGTFAFDGLADGIYRAEVHHDGYVSVVKTGVQVRAPFRAVIEIRLVRGDTPPEPYGAAEGSASVAGKVRMSRGTALAEARVRLTRPDGADEARALLTDASGAFTVPQLKAGRWRLEVQGAGLLPLRADVNLVGDVVLEAQLAPQPSSYRPPAQDLIVPEEVIPPLGTAR